MKINLKKAVRAFYPNPSFDQIFFEAVANALDAGADSISITIRVDAFDKPDTLRIDVEDNGKGFTAQDFDKFSQLLEADSKDHKGLGRLVYLAYFSRVSVVSQFDGTKRRTFNFDGSFDGKSIVTDADLPTGTLLEFRNFSGAKIHSHASLVPEKIREALLQEFMPTFFARRKAEKKLSIKIKLDTAKANLDYGFESSKAILSVDELPVFKQDSIQDQSLDFFQGIDINYSVTNDLTKSKSIVTSICVDGRAVITDLVPIEAVPAGYQMAFFFTSEYFVGKTNSSRQKLELPDEVTERVLKSILRREVGRIIEAEVPAVVEQNEKTVTELNGKYPHLSGYYPKNSPGLIVKAVALDEAQKAFFNEQRRVLECEDLDDERYQKAIELSARALMEYVLYRSRIIEKLKMMTPKDGEDAIHKIIVPMRKTLDVGSWIDDAYNNNVWLLDDKYMSYETVLSDQHMSELIKHVSSDVTSDETRPDIAIVFSGNPETNEKVSVVMVELKKHGLPLAKNEEVISQLKQRARKLLQYYPHKIERIWFFGITEITPEFRLALKEEKYQELFSQGQMFYKQHDILLSEQSRPIPVDLVVMNYAALIKDAESRNETFIRILRGRIAHFVNSQPLT